MLINIGTLVMVAENDSLFAKLGAGSVNALLAGFIGERVIRGKNERLIGLHIESFREKRPPKQQGENCE